MTTLHISHTVRDFDAWAETFHAFEEFRVEGGVKNALVRRGADDPNLVTIDLDFASAEEARTFLDRLETEVWPGSPHISGRPTTAVLETAVSART